MIFCKFSNGIGTFFSLRREQLKAMAERIMKARQVLNSKLREKEVPGDWSHILSQKGMFTFTGITAKQVAVLKEKHICCQMDVLICVLLQTEM